MVIYTPTKNSSLTNKHKEKERKKKEGKKGKMENIEKNLHSY